MERHLYCKHGIPLTGKCRRCLRAVKNAENSKKPFINRMVDPDREDRNLK